MNLFAPEPYRGASPPVQGVCTHLGSGSHPSSPSRTGVLKLECVSESPGGLLKLAAGAQTQSF